MHWRTDHCKGRHKDSNNWDSHSKLVHNWQCCGDALYKAWWSCTNTNKWTQSPWGEGEIMMPHRNQSSGVWLTSSFSLSTTLLVADAASCLDPPAAVGAAVVPTLWSEAVNASGACTTFSCYEWSPHSLHRSYIYQLAVCAPVVCKPNPLIARLND